VAGQGEGGRDLKSDPRTRESEAYLGHEEIHDRWASAYLGPDLEPFYERAFERLADALGVDEHPRLLDAGCGSCVHAARLARRGFRVTGVDFSDAALDDARAALARQGLADRVELVRGDLLALPFPDASFDAASCWGVLMHVPEVERALAELARVVRPGGRVAIMENNAASLHARLWEPALRGLKRVLGRPVPRWQRTERGIERWFEQADGGLMARFVDIDWLVRTMASHGARLVDRFPGQLTEIYVSLPRPFRRLVHRLNEAWLDHGGSARLALGNVLVFERT
jgi:SAM-dependent methyltransferase